MATAAEERAARRESIPVESHVDVEEAFKAGLPVVEPPAPEPAEPEVEAEAIEVAETEAEAPAEPAEGEETPKPDKSERTTTRETMERRIAKEKAKTQAAQERAEAAERRLAALEKKEDAGSLTPEQIAEKIRLEATVEAQKIADQRQFDNACNNLVGMAEKETPDFQKRYAAFQEDVGVLERPVIDSLLNLENGHSVLNHLLDNPDEAEKMMKLSDRRQTIELARLADKLAKPVLKAISKAPAPIKPVGGVTRTPAAPTDNDSDDAWFAKRQETRRKRDYSNR